MWVGRERPTMPTITALVAELLASLVRLVVVFVTQVALRDPLAFVSFLVGAALTTGAVAVLAYLGLRAAIDAVGLSRGSPGRAPPRRG
jgi:hypothetical protein